VPVLFGMRFFVLKCTKTRLQSEQYPRISLGQPTTLAEKEIPLLFSFSRRLFYVYSTN